MPRQFRLSVRGSGGLPADVDLFKADVSGEACNVVVLDEERQVKGAVEGVMVPPELTVMFALTGR